MTATEFRQKLYAVLSESARTGREAVVTHKGQTFRVVPEGRPGFVDRLTPHDTFLTPVDELVDDSSATAWEWTEESNLDDIP